MSHDTSRHHAIIVACIASALFAVAPSRAVDAPVAERHPHTTVTHGDTLRDDYSWLREKGSARVTAYLEAENAYADSLMAPTAALQDTLYHEMRARMQETDMAVPYRDGAFVYYTRTLAGKQYPIRCRKRGSLRAPEEVLLDQNEMAKGKAFLRIGDFEPSDDGVFIAYTTDLTGFRQYKLQVRDTRSGDVIRDIAERVTGVVWAADNTTLFFGQEDPVTKRWNKVYRCKLGSGEPELVYEEKDERFDVEVTRSRSRAYIFLVASSSTTSEVFYIPATRPTESPVSIAGRRDGHEYYADHAGDRFFIRSNDQGPNFRLVAAQVTAPGESGWTQLWGNRDDVMLEDVACFAHYYVLTERERGVPQVRVVNMRSGRSHRIDFPEPVYSVGLSDNREFNTEMLRIEYESFITPPSVFEYNMGTHARELLKERPVPGYDRSRYESKRVYARAADGTRVPISMVYRRDVKPRYRPLLLLGYGSYGLPEDVWFSSDRLSLLDRGMIFAIAHVRGGGDLGKRWHEEGRLEKKKNTFTDFIACAEYLVEEKYTSPDRLAITGRSAGGLLMGTVVNMRPDLFKVVLTAVPFVDMMNTMLDPTLPLTTGEYLEWGNPNEKAAYDYMRSYSPYDNVGHHAYPAMMVRTSLNDSQVMYWEPAKWVAELRAYKTDANPLILRTRMEAGGHGGASGRYDRLRDTAYEYAFLLTQLGIEH